METGVGVVFCLLKSITNFFVLLVLVQCHCRWFPPHHLAKESKTSQYSASFPSLMQPTIAESSENSCRWQDVELKLKSEVYRVNRKGDRTVHRVAYHSVRPSPD